MPKPNTGLFGRVGERGTGWGVPSLGYIFQEDTKSTDDIIQRKRCGDKLSCFSDPQLNDLYNGNDGHEAMVTIPCPEGLSVTLRHHQGL